MLVVTACFQTLVFASFTMKWDMMNQFLPCRYFISECLNHHIFPLWCPYINFGYPFYADPQSGLFYPITWLVALTAGYNVYAIGLEYVLHVAIAAISFYYLLKSFELDNYTAVVFGIVYCMSGMFVSNAQHLPWIITLAWLPLVLLSFKNVFDKPTWKSALSFALFLYLGITGGYPGFFIILFYFFAVYALVKLGGSLRAKDVSTVRNVILLFALAGIVFLLLTGGYLYSFIHALPYIARGKPVTLHEANNVAVTPHSLISILFPFATACASFKLDTDISMANLYCGFLLLPLLFIAVVKNHWQFFHKAIFTFALICLLAAVGHYFYVRTLLYNFLPGMNMMRHAAIFRVFTVFGLVFIAATGFNCLVNAIRNKTDATFIKRVFVAYLLCLLAVLVAVLFKNSHGVMLLWPFDTITIAAFNARHGVYAHVTTQLVFQLVLLFLFIALLLSQQLQSSVRLVLLSGLVIIEMLLSVQLNLPATVISDVHPADLQAKLDKLSTGFPVPPLSAMDGFTHFSDGSTLPVWYNLSFFKKIPAKDGFNSFYLQSVDDLNASSQRDSFLQKPVVFCKNPDSKFQITAFEPNNISIKSQCQTADVLCLQQSFYPGWKVLVDDKEEVPQHELCAMTVSVPKGNHTIRFEYRQKRVKYLFGLSVITALLVMLLLLGAKLKPSLNS